MMEHLPISSLFQSTPMSIIHTYPNLFLSIDLKAQAAKAQAAKEAEEKDKARVQAAKTKEAEQKEKEAKAARYIKK